jgi:putative ABC transport system substrate-binding protein
MSQDDLHCYPDPLRNVRKSLPHDAARRALILAAASWPALVSTTLSFAQSRKKPVLIAWLHPGSPESHGHQLAAFKEGLMAFDRKEGAELRFEVRWANAQTDRLPGLAAALTAIAPTIFVTASGSATIAAAKAAPNIPVVFILGDPMATGLVKSLARPGGLVTGVASYTLEITAKYLELLLAAAPKMRRVGVVIDASATNRAQHVENARRSIAQYKVEGHFAEVDRPEEIETALAALARQNIQGLILMPGQTLVLVRSRVVKFAQAHGWPIIGGPSEWTESGALLSYGVNQAANYRRAAYYVDRILKGTKPSDLPIERSLALELVINMKTARTLGLTIPPELMVRADRVIE